MKFRIEFQNDEHATESPVDVAEIIAPQATCIQHVAELVNKITRSTSYHQPGIVGALVQNHLRPEDYRHFVGCLSPDTRVALANHLRDVSKKSGSR